MMFRILSSFPLNGIKEKTNSKGFSVARLLSFQMPFSDNTESCEGAGQAGNTVENND